MITSYRYGLLRVLEHYFGSRLVGVAAIARERDTGIQPLGLYSLLNSTNNQSWRSPLERILVGVRRHLALRRVAFLLPCFTLVATRYAKPLVVMSIFMVSTENIYLFVGNNQSRTFLAANNFSHIQRAEMWGVRPLPTKYGRSHVLVVLVVCHGIVIQHVLL